MENPSNKHLWIKNRIRNRAQEPTWPFFGLTEQMNYSFDMLKDQLVRDHISHQKELIKTFRMMKERSYENRNKRLFKTEWEANSLPISL